MVLSLRSKASFLCGSQLRKRKVLGYEAEKTTTAFYSVLLFIPLTVAF